DPFAWLLRRLVPVLASIRSGRIRGGDEWLVPAVRVMGFQEPFDPPPHFGVWTVCIEKRRSLGRGGRAGFVKESFFSHGTASKVRVRSAPLCVSHRQNASSIFRNFRIRLGPSRGRRGRRYARHAGRLIQRQARGISQLDDLALGRSWT